MRLVTINMRWARRILIAITLVVALIGAAIILLLTIDLSRFKSNLEAYVTDVTGRQFVIAGRFEPSIGKTVNLVAENILKLERPWERSFSFILSIHSRGCNWRRLAPEATHSQYAERPVLAETGPSES